MANHRRGLEQVLLLRGQPVDTCCQHGMHRGGHLEALQRVGQPVGATLASQDPSLHQCAHALLQKEGVTIRAFDQEPFERRQAGIVSQQGL